MVDVDASHTGVGAVLFQQSIQDQKLHPYAFFSLKLFPAKSNNNIGSSSPTSAEPVEVLPTSCIIKVVFWEIKHKVKQSHTEHLPVVELLNVFLFELACHPGVGHTLAYLCQSFRWSLMKQDSQEFVTTCQAGPPTTTCSWSTLNPLLPGLCHWPPYLWWSYSHYYSRHFSPNCLFHTKETAKLLLHMFAFMFSSKYCLWSETSTHPLFVLCMLLQPLLCSLIGRQKV